MLTTALLLMLVIDGQYHAYEIESWDGDDSPAVCIEVAKQYAKDHQTDALHCEIRGFISL